jgi:8-oxo-dGTP pyrophosphatase MutT (NUDIX family)
MAKSRELFKLVITAIVVKREKFLIAKRSLREEKFPGRWTVPGGKLHVSDYAFGSKDTLHYWYNVLEKALAREVYEEARVRIANIRYVTSLADKPEGKDPSVVLSMMGDWTRGVPKPTEELIEFAWVTLQEAKKYDLIEGIHEELEQAAKLLQGERTVWKRKK